MKKILLIILFMSFLNVVEAGEKLYFRRGYDKGYPIFTVKYQGTIYASKTLGKLSKILTECEGETTGIFNTENQVTFRYGKTTKVFTFNSVNFQTDTKQEILAELKTRFIKIKNWKASLNNIEEFDIDI